MSRCPQGANCPSRPGATNEVTSNALRAINQTGDSGGPIATDPIKDDQTQCPLLLAGRPYYRLQLPTWSVALLQTWMSRWRLTPSAPSQCSLLKLPALTAPALNATPRPSPGPLFPGQFQTQDSTPDSPCPHAHIPSSPPRQPASLWKLANNHQSSLVSSPRLHHAALAIDFSPA